MKTDAVLVYVAGHVHAAIFAGIQIQQAGHLAHVPHFNHFADKVVPMGSEVWMSYDLRMLRRCDVLLRLPGHSPGADREVLLAKTLGMPIYETVEACLADLTVLECGGVP